MVKVYGVNIIKYLLICFTIYMIYMQLVISEIALIKYIASVQVLHAVLSQKHNIPSSCFLIPFVGSYTVEKRDPEIITAMKLRP